METTYERDRRFGKYIRNYYSEKAEWLKGIVSVRSKPVPILELKNWKHYVSWVAGAEKIVINNIPWQFHET